MQSFSVKCVSPFDAPSTCASDDVGDSETLIPAGRTSGVVTNLPPSSVLKCFVLTSAADGTDALCAPGVTVMTTHATLVAADMPTGVACRAVNQTSVTCSWTGPKLGRLSQPMVRARAPRAALPFLMMMRF